MMNSNILKGWIFYISFLMGDIFVDAFVRLSNEGSFRSNGLPEEVWFLVHFFAVGLLFYFLLREIRLSEKGDLLKLRFLVVNFFFAAIVYVLAIYGYVIGFGIDSF